MHKIHTEQLDNLEKRRLWDEIVQDFLQSGFKLKQYSHQHGLNYDHLSYYLQKHRKIIRQAEINPTAFIPVEITTPNTSSQYAIRVDNIEILLPASFRITQIAALVQELRKSAC
jgi:hypothetical protein